VKIVLIRDHSDCLREWNLYLQTSCVLKFETWTYQVQFSGLRMGAVDRTRWRMEKRAVSGIDWYSFTNPLLGACLVLKGMRWRKNWRKVHVGWLQNNANNTFLSGRERRPHGAFNFSLTLEVYVVVEWRPYWDSSVCKQVRIYNNKSVKRAVIVKDSRQRKK